MARLDHTIQIIQTLERHTRKIEELMKRVKKLEAAYMPDMGEVMKDFKPDLTPKRRGRPPKAA